MAHVEPYILSHSQAQLIRDFLGVKHELSHPPFQQHHAVTSRKFIRTFLAIFTTCKLYEDVLLGFLRRKQRPFILRNLFSKPSSASAARLALAFATYASLYRIIKQLASQHVQPTAKQWLNRPRRFSVTRPVDPNNVDGQRKPRSKLSLYRPQGRENLFNFLASPYSAPFLAALVAGSALSFEKPGSRRTTITLYAVSAAAQAMYSATIRRAGDYLPEFITSRQKSFWWGGHLLFALANAQLLHSVVYDPDCFPATYEKFTLSFSGPYLADKPKYLPESVSWPSKRQIVDTLAAVTSSVNPYPNYASPLLHNSNSHLNPKLNTIKPVLDWSTHAAHDRLVCGFLHSSETSCRETLIACLNGQGRKAIKFSLILSAITTLFSYKRAVARPWAALYLFLKNSIVNGSFIVLALSTAWSTICLFQRLLPGRFIPRGRFYLQGFLAGLWAYILPASRATALGMYTARFALLSSWQEGVKKRKWKTIKGGDVALFSVAAACVVAAWDGNKHHKRQGMVYKMLDTWLGEEESVS